MIFSKFLDHLKKGVVDKIHYETQAFGFNLASGSAKDAIMDAPYDDFNLELAIQAYKKIPIVNASVRYIASSVASVPLNVYKNIPSKNEKIEVFNGEPYSLLNWVNPRMTQYELMYYTGCWLSLASSAFWVIEPTPKEYMRPGVSALSIFLLNPLYVKIQADPDNGVNLYIYEINNKRVTFTEDQIIHFKGFNPDNYWFGNLDMASLSVDFQIERYGKKKSKNWFANSALLSGFLKLNENPGDEEIAKLERKFTNISAKTNQAYRVLVLSADMSYEPFKQSYDDGYTDKAIELSNKSITMVLGVPISLLEGQPPSGSIKALVESERVFWAKTAKPMIDRVCTKLTKELAQPANRNYIVCGDFSEIYSLQTFDLEKARVDVALVNTGIMSLNEIRQRRGKEPFKPDADDPLFEKYVNGPVSYYGAKNKSAGDNPDPESMGLPGTGGSDRNQTENGEAQLVDESGEK